MTKESTNQEPNLKPLCLIVIGEIVLSLIASGVYLVTSCWNLITKLFE